MWPLRPLLFSNSGVRSFTSQKNQISYSLCLYPSRLESLTVYLKTVSVGPAEVWTCDLLTATRVRKGLHIPIGELDELGPYFESAEILPFFADWLRFQLGAKDESVEERENLTSRWRACERWSVTCLFALIQSWGTASSLGTRLNLGTVATATIMLIAARGIYVYQKPRVMHDFSGSRYELDKCIPHTPFYTVKTR